MTELDLSSTCLCACGNLRRATRVLTQYYDEALKPIKLRVTQFSVLANIARNGPLTVSQLAELMLMDQTTMTRNLSQLEKQNFIQRITGADQRTRVLMLTEAGQAVLENAYPYWKQAQAQLESGMGPERLKGLLKEMSVLTKLAQ